MEQLGFGADISPQDPRTVVHGEVAFEAIPEIKGGIDYLPEDIEHQHGVGICTAISLTQNQGKANGKKYSADFQYLLQKKFFDLAWYEGSSIFHALKVAKNIGFLPAELWTHTTEADRYLPYSQYITKLQSIPAIEIQRLISLCVDKIKGYASVDVSNPTAIAKAISDSKSGILCRYECGATWYTPSWKAKDINPLRRPNPATSGHAIIMNKYNYSDKVMQKLANTWGSTWCLQGCADINYTDYRMTEAWTILNFIPEIPPYVFTKTLRIGMRGSDVKQLQKKLGIPADSIFGPITQKIVKAFQASHGLVADGIVGPKTNLLLNTL